MYLIVIAWLYVVLMMSIAEATSTTGSLLGAIVTFVLYGGGPVTLVVYLMGAPARNKALKKRQAEELSQHLAAQAHVATAQTTTQTTAHIETPRDLATEPGEVLSEPRQNKP